MTEGVSVIVSRGRDGVEAPGTDSWAMVGSDRYSAYGHLSWER